MKPKIKHPETYNPEKGKAETQQEYILCAAIRRKEPKICDRGEPYHPGLNDILNIEIGFRHHDIFCRFYNEVSTKPNDQGFYTSRGRFVEREEGMLIAYEAGQVTEKQAFLGRKKVPYNKDNYKDVFNILFSEDLY